MTSRKGNVRPEHQRTLCPIEEERCVDEINEGNEDGEAGGLPIQV